MALYKGKRQKHGSPKSTYVEDYRTRRSSQVLRAVIMAAILIALFALGFFVIEPLLEKYYHSIKDSESGESEAVSDGGFNEIDVGKLFSEQD